MSMHMPTKSSTHIPYTHAYTCLAGPKKTSSKQEGHKEKMLSKFERHRRWDADEVMAVEDSDEWGGGVAC